MNEDFDRIRAEQVSMLSANAVMGAISGIAGAGILAVVLIVVQNTPSTWVIVWFASLLAVLLLQIILSARHRKNSTSSCGPWAFSFTVLALASGIVWGVGVVVIAANSTIDTELLVLMVSSGISAGAGLSYGCLLPTFYARFLPTNLPYIAWAALHGDALHVFLAIFASTFVIGIIQLVRQYNYTVIEMIKLRFENVDLVGELRIRTDAANLANVTKSRFLAAASHDLRQPVHALNLFVGALQACNMDDVARRLVRQINSSISALDNLFVSLLDISKLDAGIVSLNPHNFAILPLLDRICADHSTQAQAKGIRLDLHPCSRAVHGDPILLERILRNLVSNAVRYTVQGRVVVGCRRKGKSLSIEVWDTGLGISEDDQPRVFQAFYQIGNPERDRTDGIGLGLAIVKRLAEVQAFELSLASRVGSGSVFKILVPVADQPPRLAETTSASEFASATRGLILVIDDEGAIQKAMQSLLTSWGHDVVVAGSADEILQKIGQIPARPDLIICDLRLRRGENGIQLIKRLQFEYNQEIPAVLITGDTAPDRLRAAQESGLCVLYKPVPNAVLQSTINDLMNSKRAPEDK